MLVIDGIEVSFLLVRNCYHAEAAMTMGNFEFCMMNAEKMPGKYTEPHPAIFIQHSSFIIQNSSVPLGE